MLLYSANEDESVTGMTVAEATFRKLLRLVTLGKIPPGADVTEEGLASTMKVSRTPLRDAVRRLEGMGIFVRRTNRTLFVPPLSEDELRDLSIAREALEVAIVNEAAKRVRTRQASLEKLEMVHLRMKQMAQLQDTNYSLEAGLEFHRELYQLADLPTATAVLSQIIIRIERYRQLIKGDVERSKRVVKEHDALVDALRKGDAEAAEAAMRQHIRTGRAMYIKRIRKSK